MTVTLKEENVNTDNHITLHLQYKCSIQMYLPALGPFFVVSFNAGTTQLQTITLSPSSAPSCPDVPPLLGAG